MRKLFCILILALTSTLAYAQRPDQIELACPAGFSPMPYGQTYNQSTGKIRQVACINNNGDVRLNLPNAGTFTNNQMSEGSQFLTGPVDPLTEFQLVQGNANYATNALVGGISVPLGSTVHNANAIAAFANTSSSSQGSGGTVGAYLQCIVLVNGGHCEGLNPVAIDVSGLTSGVNMQSAEFDVQPQNPLSAYATGAVDGITIKLFTPQSGVFTTANGIYIDAPQAGIWGNAIQIKDGKAVNALVAGTANASGASNSQNIVLSSNNGTSDVNSTIFSNSLGSISLNPEAGFVSLLSNGSYKASLLWSSLVNSPNITFPDATGTLSLQGNTCTMIAGTSCTSTVAYGSDCVATVQGTSPIASACQISGTTLTVTAASSNSDTWAWHIVK